MLFQPGATISEIVRSDYRTADVFKKYQINFCCSGKVPLQEACEVRNLDMNTLVHELEEATRNLASPTSTEINEWDISFLTDYIRNVHHAYLYSMLPALEIQMFSFMEGHKKKYPIWIKIYDLFLELATELNNHNRHEDDIIFPYIKEMSEANKKHETFANFFVRSLRQPVNVLEHKHQKIDKLFDELRSLSNDFSIPKNVCTNHQVLYHKLHELYNDYQQHHHLEKDFLFPKAIALEKKLQTSMA